MDNDDVGRRKDGKVYAPGNTREDGSYETGRNRPPAATRFAKDDGRARGRRPKGTRNFDTEFAEESARLMPVVENGKTRKVPKRRAAIIRLYDNANGKGQNAALEQVIRHNFRIAEKAQGSPRSLSLTDQQIVEAWLSQRGIQPSGDPDSQEDGADLPEGSRDDQ